MAAGLGLPAAAHAGWMWTSERLYDVSADADRISWEPFHDPAAERRYRAADRPARTGTTELTVRPTPDAASGADADWRLVAEHDAALDPDDPLARDVRGGAADLSGWLPFRLSLTAGATDCAAAGLIDEATVPRLTQQGPEALAHAHAVARTEWWDTALSCPSRLAGSVSWDVLVTVTIDEDLLGDGPRTGSVYDAWTLTVDASDARTVSAVIGGDVLSQTATEAEVALPEKGEVVIALDVSDERETAWDHAENGDENHWAELGNALQTYNAPTREATCALAALAAVTGAWALPLVRRWAPPATRTRWTVATVTGAGVTGTALGYALAGTYQGPWDAWWVIPARGMPLTVCWWVLLPFLLAACAVRMVTGRPPGVRPLLPLLLPGALLLVPVAMVAAVGPGRTAVVPVGTVLAGAAGAILTAVALRRGLLGTAGRRWAAVVGGAVWLAVLTAGPGTGLPEYTPMRDVVRFLDAPGLNLLTLNVLVWFWPGAVWVVLAALTRQRWVAALAAVALWAALASTDGRYWIYWWALAEGSWAEAGVDATSAANQPLPVLQTVALVAAGLVAWRHGRTPGRWPRHVRAVVLTVGIAAVATRLTWDGFAVFVVDDLDTTQRSGHYLSVVVAAVGLAWLLPATGEAQAQAAHAVSPRAHARRMHALLKDQTMAASRREFLATSRSALAAGELTPREWSTRWRGLGAFGPRGTAAEHSAQLRLAALGSAGGRDAWRNGLTAAVLLTALSLPWVAYTLPPELAQISYQLRQVVPLWTKALRWALYGFAFGYAYPWLRGGTPIGRAMCLFAVVLPAECLPLLYQSLEPGRFGVSLLLTAGNCLAIFLVLGLCWEARLVRAAGLRWGQIRNFRSLSALALPTTTVLVASATALATAMVGVWVAPDSAPPPEPQQQQEQVPDDRSPTGNGP